MKSSVAGMAGKKPSQLRLRKETIVEIIAALFILLFLYTAISKSLQVSKTESVLRRTPFFSSIAVETAWLVVCAEYIVAALLFFPATKKAGLYGSFILMLGFTIYVSWMMAFVPNLPCTCGGIISKMTWGEHLIFNIIFTTLAVIGIKLHRRSGMQRSQNSEPPNIIFT